MQVKLIPNPRLQVGARIGAYIYISLLPAALLFLPSSIPALYTLRSHLSIQHSSFMTKYMSRAYPCYQRLTLILSKEEDDSTTRSSDPWLFHYWKLRSPCSSFILCDIRLSVFFI